MIVNNEFDDVDINGAYYCFNADITIKEEDYGEDADGNRGEKCYSISGITVNDVTISANEGDDYKELSLCDITEELVTAINNYITTEVGNNISEYIGR